MSREVFVNARRLCRSREPPRLCVLNVHQVTLPAIEEWTGLDFGPLRDVDKLQWAAPTERARELGQEPAWPVIRSAADITYASPARRARGLRAVRGAGRSVVSDRVRSDPAGGCECEAGQFDARAAVEALSQDLARLTDALTALGAPADRGGPRTGGESEASSAEVRTIEVG